jgi:hypothetical protein
MRRLHRGFHALISGLQEKHGGERLHQFVTAIEAIIKPAEGKGRRQFVHRGQLLVGESDASARLLDELYNLRSLEEHLMPLDSLLNTYPSNRRHAIALQRSFLAQAIASRIYERILSNPTVLAGFASDDALTSFWQSRRADQEAIWGDPIDVTSLTARFDERLLAHMELA